MTDQDEHEDELHTRRDPPRHDARTLIGADRTARIMLDGTAYTLRITRAGKLILTK